MRHETPAALFGSRSEARRGRQGEEERRRRQEGSLRPQGMSAKHVGRVLTSNFAVRPSMLACLTSNARRSFSRFFSSSI